MVTPTMPPSHPIYAKYVLRACVGDTELLNSLNLSPTRTRIIHFRVYRRLGGMTPHITPQNEEYTEKKSHNPLEK